jgi:hypothetical protein
VRARGGALPSRHRTPATLVTAITLVRQLVAVIAKGFILAKENYRISATILRDNKIQADLGKA